MINKKDNEWSKVSETEGTEAIAVEDQTLKTSTYQGLIFLSTYFREFELTLNSKPVTDLKY